MSFDSEVNEIPTRVETLEEEVRRLREEVALHLQGNVTLNKALGELAIKHNSLIAALRELTSAVEKIQKNAMSDREAVDLVALSVLMLMGEKDSSGN